MPKSDPEKRQRRSFLRRIRNALAPYMTMLAAGGMGFLFTEQKCPDHPLPEGRASRSIRLRAMPGERDTSCGFTESGIVVDYVAGSVLVAGWRQLRTGQLRALADIAESEARMQPVRRQRADANEARAAAKVHGQAAVRRREALLARARRAGPEGVVLRGEPAHRAGMQLSVASLGEVVRRDGEEAQRFVAATGA